jgi:hypothetical protein
MKLPADCGNLARTDHRVCIPEANLSTMSVKTASVSMPFMTPVISNSTNPCMADQNSSAA